MKQIHSTYLSGLLTALILSLCGAGAVLALTGDLGQALVALLVGLLIGGGIFTAAAWRGRTHA